MHHTISYPASFLRMPGEGGTHQGKHHDGGGWGHMCSFQRVQVLLTVMPYTLMLVPLDELPAETYQTCTPWGRTVMGAEWTGHTTTPPGPGKTLQAWPARRACPVCAPMRPKSSPQGTPSAAPSPPPAPGSTNTPDPCPTSPRMAPCILCGPRWPGGDHPSLVFPR